MEEQSKWSCIICDQLGTDGILICSEFICAECEAEIVHTDVKDSKYPFFIHQMKQIGFKMNA